MESLVCKFNQFGFCKYEKTCRKRHNNSKCDYKDCDLNTCEKRHPKPCTYFLAYNRCKFGSFCRFNHSDEKEVYLKTLTSRIESLEETVVQNNQAIDQMREKIEALENKCSNDDESHVNYTQDSYVSDVTFLECVQCDKTFESENGLISHMDTHKTIEQIDGNVSLVDDIIPQLIGSYVYCDLCNYQSTCEKSLNIHTVKVHENPKPKKKKKKRSNNITLPP